MVIIRLNAYNLKTSDLALPLKNSPTIVSDEECVAFGHQNLRCRLVGGDVPGVMLPP